MEERVTIFNLLNIFSSIQKNASWKMKCLYADGIGTTINQINIIALPKNNNIGMFIYQVETGKVTFCKYKSLKKSNAKNIVDLLLKVINYTEKKHS